MDQNPYCLILRGKLIPSQYETRGVMVLFAKHQAKSWQVKENDHYKSPGFQKRKQGDLTNFVHQNEINIVKRYECNQNQQE